MTQLIINTGTGPNTKDGDPIRTAFSKINSNFNELYGVVAPNQYGNSGKYLTTDGTTLMWSDKPVPADLIELTDATHLLGNTIKPIEHIVGGTNTNNDGQTFVADIGGDSSILLAAAGWYANGPGVTNELIHSTYDTQSTKIITISPPSAFIQGEHYDFSLAPFTFYNPHLPANKTGYLHNDGAGTLSWTAGDSINTILGNFNFTGSTLQADNPTFKANDATLTLAVDSNNWTFGTDGRGPATSISLNPGPAVGYATASNVPTNTDSGTGFGLTVDIVADGFSISSVVINQPGQGYSVGDQLQIDQPSSTGTGEITVTGVSSNTPVITLPYGHTIGSGSSDGIKLTTDRGTILLGNTPECGTTTHFHIMKQDPYHVDLFLGDDLNYVKLKGYENIPPSMPYGVEIGTNDGSAQLWRFGTDGTTTFPRNTIDSGANEIALKSHKYSELHWQSDQLVSQVNAPSDNFVGVDDQGAYISTVGTEYANTWAFGNNGTLRFPDGTVQTTAYDSMPLDNIGIDGGAASAVYEVSRLFADGGSAGNRFGPNDPIFDGTSAGVVYGPSDLVLNGGVA
jgi:hypothetical protein